jgi:hypothetical protein
MFLARVRPGEEQGLDEVLAGIEKDFAGNPHLRLADSTSTHFARWNVVRDTEHGPRLLFCANFDGDQKAYLAELASVGPGMDEIWGRCEGWRSRDHLREFVRDTACRARGVYVGFPSETVAQIRNYIAIREEVEAFLDLGDVASFLDDPGCLGFLDRLARVPAPVSWERVLRHRLADLGDGIRRAVLAQYLKLARAFAQQGRAKTYPLVRTAAPPGVTEQELDSPVSRATVQNEMTVLSDVLPERLIRLQVGLAASVPLARFGFPPGQFADVGTLHWFAWSLIDGGRRLLFVSTFDGSWQRYLQDFINKIIWAIDAIWGNTSDYPPAGMKDVVAYTDWILNHQYPAKAMYSAYSHETVMNLINDRSLSRELGRAFDRPTVERWLARL